MVVTNLLKVVERRDGQIHLSQLPIPEKRKEGKRKRGSQPREAQVQDRRRTIAIDDELHQDIRRSRFNLQPGRLRLVREGVENRNA